MCFGPSMNPSGLTCQIMIGEVLAYFSLSRLEAMGCVEVRFMFLIQVFSLVQHCIPQSALLRLHIALRFAFELGSVISCKMTRK